MKIALNLLILLILASTLVSATDFYVKSVPIKKDIFSDEAAEFNITITNFLGISDVFTVSAFDPSWNLLTNQILVPADSSKSFVLKINPGSEVPLGIHAINVKFKSSQIGEFMNKVFTINIRPYDPVFGIYRPSIQFSANIDKEVDPRKKIPIEIYLRNRNALDIGELEIEIESTLFQDKVTTTLGPLEEKRTEYLYKIDELQEPGLFSLDVKLLVKDVVISQSTQTYEVIGYSTIIQDRESKSFLFKTTETITLENLGNSKKTKKVNLAMSWLKRMLTNSDPKSTTVGKSLEWDITLNSQELRTIIVTTNYRRPIFLLIIIFISLILYYIYRSPIIITKEAFAESQNDEGLEHLKIRLFVKNRTRKIVDRIGIIDRIPSIAQLLKSKKLGTIHPEKITPHEKKGTIIKWNIESLEPFEERIITYEIKSRLKIIGNLSLPEVRIKFMDGNKERIIYSNRVMVSN
ncbi:hypothetical protein CMO90_03565 [Candidatus Woesearchaeota archaeon]|jgi:hypothetical protein|nr:hypothetical protein [Candidatus Woesearchaeota archaeon]